MIRKYGTINEEVNRIKSLFGESRLYGNLITEGDIEVDIEKELTDMNNSQAVITARNNEYNKKIHSLITKNGERVKWGGVRQEPETAKEILKILNEWLVELEKDDIEFESRKKRLSSHESYDLYVWDLKGFDSPHIKITRGISSDVKGVIRNWGKALKELVGNHNDDKPEGWYAKPVDLLRLYGVPDAVIVNMETELLNEDYMWEYRDSEYLVSIYGKDGKPSWGKFNFIEEGMGYDFEKNYWVGKLIQVFNIGKDNQNSYVMEGNLLGDYLLDGKYNNLWNADEYGVEWKTEGEIKNGYITIDGETTDPFKVDGGIVKSVDDEIYKKVQELRSEDGNPTVDDTTKGDNTTKDGGDGAKDGSEITTLEIDTKTAIVNGYVEDKPQNGEYDTFESSDGILVYKVKTDDNTDNKVDIKSDDKSEMKEGYNTEEDIIHKSSKMNKKYNIGKFVYDKKNDEFKIKSKYPFLLKKSKMVMKSMDETFWKTLNKWYDKPLNSNNTTLDIINDKKFKVKKKI